MTANLRKMDQPDSEMMTSEQVAKLMGVSRRYLDKDRHEARQNGTSPKLPYVNLGHRTVRYKRSDVVAFLDANRVD
jgi:predicted DNA-binding transcriptional regulator AlpA